MHLDLDVGSMSFALNGKDLGVAVEGLVGPLYAAFSLYNEDDQISIIPQKTLDVRSQGPLGHSSGWSQSYANTSERILNRLDVLSMLQRRHLDGYRMSAASADAVAQKEDQKRSLLSSSAPAMTVALNEFEKRWKLWTKGIHIRSFICDDGFVSVVVSGGTLRCSVLSTHMPPSTDGKPFSFYPGREVILEGQVYTVLGAANHRIWLQKQSNGKIVGHSGALSLAAPQLRVGQHHPQYQ